MDKFVKGFGFALKGLLYALATQLNFKIHCLMAVAVVATGLIIGLSTSEWLWIALAMVLVLMAELFNTAIEELVNLVSPNFSPQAGLVKDLAAGAVLVVAVFAFIVGILVFGPKLWQYVA